MSFYGRFASCRRILYSHDVVIVSQKKYLRFSKCVQIDDEEPEILPRGKRR